MASLSICILAAGKGKRMGQPDRAKVLTPLGNTPLLGYVLDTAQALHPDHIVVIVGYQGQSVSAYVREQAPFAAIVEQTEQLGTGHAVQQTHSVLHSTDSDIVILSGDVPLLTVSTLQNLISHHRSTNADLTVLTTYMDDATGYGRIARDAGGSIQSIVEHKDATPEQLHINEVNAGVYVVRSSELFPALKEVTNNNAQGEYYLTDIVEILLKNGKRVETFVCKHNWETQGVNTQQDLDKALSILHETLNS